MASASTQLLRLRFGHFELNAANGEVRKNGARIKLGPQPTKLLVLLASHADEVVTRQQLKQHLWGDETFVDFEQGLNFCIRQVRAALADNADHPSYIETVPKLGYRFVASVEPVWEAQELSACGCNRATPTAEQHTQPPPPARSNSRLKILISLAGASFLLLAITVFLTLRIEHVGSAEHRQIHSIAVLPLTNLSGDHSQDYFADGMTEALITDLSKLGDVQVISRGSVMHYKSSRPPAAEMGRQLNVDAVVEGAVLRAGDRVRVTAQLVRSANDENIWAEQYERDLSDVVALQDELASSIAKQINAQVIAAQRGHATRLQQPSFEAQDAYLKGRYFWNQRTEPDYLTAIHWFEEAIGDDPSYAAAYAGLADTYALLGSMPNSEIERRVAMPRAKAAAEKALQLDPSLADAHTSLAFVKMHYEWDWAGAEREFRRAIELNPNYATAHHWYTYDLFATNRVDQAIAEMQRARALDPLSPIINTDLAETYLYAHRLDDALAQGQAAVALDPSFSLAHIVLERIYIAKHMPSQAIREAERAVQLDSRDRWAQARLGEALAYAGRKEQTRKIVKNLELQFVAGGSRDDLTVLYAALEDRDRLFRAAETLYVNHDGGLILLNFEEAWDPYRSDPRFRDLVRRVGLPPKN